MAARRPHRRIRCNLTATNLTLPLSPKRMGVSTVISPTASVSLLWSPDLGLPRILSSNSYERRRTIRIGQTASCDAVHDIGDDSELHRSSASPRTPGSEETMGEDHPVPRPKDDRDRS